jgi:hypothetical protein
MPLLAGIVKKVFFVLAIGASGYLFYSYAVPCKVPVRYTIGVLDERFGLSEESLKSALAEAEALWEKPAGVELFVYEKGASMPVNLIYDGRQATTEKNNTIKESIDRTTDTADTVKEAYDEAESKYQSMKSSYLSVQTAYEAQLKAYNDKVAYWNARGGAPPSEYRALQSQKAAVQYSSDALEKQRVALNMLAEQVNALSTRYNELAQKVNTGVDAINKTAGREFEEGLYVKSALSSRIDIFEFSNRSELVRVLAHELGHSLGLNHNDNPDSIMYALNESENSIPTKEDIASLRSVCRLQ